MSTVCDVCDNTSKDTHVSVLRGKFEEHYVCEECLSGIPCAGCHDLFLPERHNFALDEDANPYCEDCMEMLEPCAECEIIINLKEDDYTPRDLGMSYLCYSCAQEKYDEEDEEEEV